jgi:hypothetical protein
MEKEQQMVRDFNAKAEAVQHLTPTIIDGEWITL